MELRLKNKKKKVVYAALRIFSTLVVTAGIVITGYVFKKILTTPPSNSPLHIFIILALLVYSIGRYTFIKFYEMEKNNPNKNLWDDKIIFTKFDKVTNDYHQITLYPFRYFLKQP